MADKLIPTPSQTVGPFFHLGMARAEWSDLTADHPAGEKIAIEGQVTDGDGAPVPDAIIELWQANAAGRYNHPDDKQTDKPIDPHFRGFGRRACGDSAGSSGCREGISSPRQRRGRTPSPSIRRGNSRGDRMPSMMHT